MKKIINNLLAVLGIVIFLTSCGPTAYIQKAKNVNFSNYRTYAWVDAKGKIQGTKKMGITEQMIKDVMSQQIESKYGLAVDNKRPDILLSYDVLVERGSRVVSDPVYSNGFFRTYYNPYNRRFYNVYYPSTLMGYDNYREPTKEGTITITATDARTENVLVQGWASDDIEGRKLTTKQANKIVNAIVKKWDQTVK